MDLVIDANILFAALIKNDVTTELIFHEELNLYAPEFLLEEFKEHEREILKKTDQNYTQFIKLLEILKKNIRFIPYSDFKKFMIKANEITPDADDSAYIALALKMNCGIWSNDKKLKRLKDIEVISTGDLLRSLS